MSYDLRGLVHEVLSQSQIGDLDNLATLVFRRIVDEDAAEDALREALPDYVRRIVVSDRNRKPNTTGSWKINAQQAQPDWWETELDKRYPTADGWRLLRDLTAKDLLACATERRTQAARNLSKAEHLESIAEAMERHGVEHVEDLPRGEAARIYGVAEAGAA